MTDRFPSVLPITLRQEGGYSNDPHDPGGPTMRGVIQRVYDGYRDGRGLPRRHVRSITDTELTDIYRTGYWDMIRGGELPPGIDMCVFDFCVNSGPGTATRHLQRVLGVVADGHMGPATIAAASRADPVRTIDLYMTSRRAYLRSLRTFWRFGKGWLSRCDEVQKAALEMATRGGGYQTEPLHENPDEQSATQGRASSPDPSPPRATEAALAAGGSLSVANVAPNVVSRAAESGRVTLASLAIALLSEPLFWAGMVMLWGSLAAWLWRRRYAT